MNQDLKLLLRGIFQYHHIQQGAEINMLWWNDLKSFDALDVEKAWNEWRKHPDHQKRKPTSQELRKIILRDKTEAAVLPPLYEPLQIGRGFTEDRLIDKMQKMKDSNPSLYVQIKECKNIFEKMALCQQALGEKIDNPYLQHLLKKWQ